MCPVQTGKDGWTAGRTGRSIAPGSAFRPTEGLVVVVARRCMKGDGALRVALTALCLLVAAACGSPVRPPITLPPWQAPDALADAFASPKEVSYTCEPPTGAAPPTTFGPAFLELTAMLAAPPFALHEFAAGTEPEEAFGIIADLDGDGLPEVLLSPTYNDYSRPTVVYRLVASGAGLVPAPELAMPAAAHILAAVDLDGDGLPDLLDREGDLGIAWGKAKGKFEAVAPLKLTNSIFASALTPYLDDLDQDGWLDLLVGVPCCGQDPGECRDLHPLLCNGPRSYVDQTQLVQEVWPGKPYAVLSATLPSGDRVIAQLGAACIGDASVSCLYRQNGLNDEGFPRYEPFDPAPEDAVFRDSSKPEESMATRSPMAAAVGDLDGDGLMDLAVMMNPIHTLLKGRATTPLVEQTPCTGFQQLMPDKGSNPMLPWGVALVDLDRDGRPDVVTAHGNDTGGWQDASKFTGPQHATAYWNAGNLHFVDVTDALGLGRRGQWRAMVVGDLEGDGDADLVIGAKGELPRVYLNHIDTGNHGFALRLHGTTSNHLGIGARIDVPALGSVPAQHLLMGGVGSPTGVSEPLVFVALGPAKSLPSLTITWPSGTVQAVQELAAGQIHDVQEPQVLELTPANRRVPADAKSAVTVRITPRAADGSPRDDTVQLTILKGTGSVSAPTRDGLAWVFQVQAPSQPGFCLLEARIGGAAVTVRPHLWWN